MARLRAKSIFPPAEHDHAVCVKSVQRRAEKAFEGAGLRMTPLRAGVLEQVASSHQAIGAYEILERMAKTGQRLAPISVYRALDALVAAGVVHRLESRNAFFTCQHTHATPGHYLVLVCSRCGRVAETPAPAVWTAIGDAVAALDFAFEGSLVEVLGQCGQCAATS